jgi:hypothetical protein
MARKKTKFWDCIVAIDKNPSVHCDGVLLYTNAQKQQQE